MLPPICDGRPACVRMWWISAVVVDLPFDPVTQITRGGVSNASHPSLAKLRKNRPMSLSTGTPRAIACAIAGCGAG